MQDNYYCHILSNVHDLLASPETYRSVLKSFLNDEKIPSTRYVQHSHVTYEYQRLSSTNVTWFILEYVVPCLRRLYL